MPVRGVLLFAVSASGTGADSDDLRLILTCKNVINEHVHFFLAMDLVAVWSHRW